MRVTQAVIRAAAVAAALAATGCGVAPDGDGPTNNGSVPVTTPAGDSILPMDTMIARYQAGLPPVSSLTADAPTSADALIDRFAVAVRAGSGAGLDSLTMTESEFAYLYFPTSIYARPPYEQPPAVNWLLLEQNSLKGRLRLLRDLGGTDLVIEGWRCDAEPKVEGENRILDGCVVQVRDAGAVIDMRLFGSIIERNGRYKFMSLANRL